MKRFLFASMLFLAASSGVASADFLKPSDIVNKLKTLSGTHDEATLHGHTAKGEACDLVARTNDINSEFWIRPADVSADCQDVNDAKSKCRMSGIPDRFQVLVAADRWYFSSQPFFPDKGDGLYIKKSNFDIPLSITFPAFANVPEYTCYFETQNI